jgi:hypothetical protein
MFLFVIPVCVVLVFWQWKNDLIPCLHFYIWYPGNGKTFLCYSCLHCIGILAMEKFDSLNIWYPWKNHVCPAIFIIGILVREGCFGLSCMRLHLASGQ